MNRSYLLPQHLFKRHFRTPAKVAKARSAAAKRATGKAAETPDPSLSAYLNARLKQIGVTHVIAIPGDYIAEWVETLDSPTDNPGPDPLVRVHPNNEMCATYAADGYGRATGGTGVGCVAFTYGVGALNAVQAVAGAGVESVPVVVINGSPSPAQYNSQRDQGVLWHHMFDGSHTDLRIFQEITEMAVRIDNPAYAADLIDAALTACITASKPVYIEIATTMELYDIVGGAERLQTPLTAKPVPTNEDDLDEAVSMVWSTLQGAEKLVLLGGVEVARFGLQDKFAQLSQLLQAPYLSSLLGKGILSEYSAPNFSGTYNGQNSQDNVQQLVKGADVILAIGVHETDFNFAGVASADFNPDTYPGLPMNFAIEARLGAVRINSGISPSEIGEVYWGDVSLSDLIDALIEKLEAGPLPNAPFPGIQGEIWDIPPSSDYPDGDQITWDSFKSLLYNEYLAKFDEQSAPVLLADTGLTFYNLNNIKVPQNGYIAQLAWGAIGYSPAASYGVKLALEAKGQGQRRVISVSGDGAFAESANAIGTIAELGQDNVIFVMANGVFAIEQFLVNANAFCDDGPDFVALTQVPQTSLWDWKKVAEGFGGVGYEVTTNKELSDVLEKLQAGSPPPTNPSGPCTGTSSPGCCTFEPSVAPITRTSTFTLIAVRNVCDDLPSNTKWKLTC